MQLRKHPIILADNLWMFIRNAANQEMIKMTPKNNITTSHDFPINLRKQYQRKKSLLIPIHFTDMVLLSTTKINHVLFAYSKSLIKIYKNVYQIPETLADTC